MVSVQEKAGENDPRTDLSLLARGLAHEIRNPLSTISMNLQLLAEDWAAPANPKESRTINRIRLIQNEANRLETILSDFLRFTHAHQPAFARQDLNDVVEESLRFFEPRLASKGIAVTKLFDPTIPEMDLDRDRLKQAFANLIINAEQAMEKGGGLFVRTVNRAAAAAAAEVQIIDTGAGVADEARDRLFDVYYSTKSGGAGLGLPLVKTIVCREHGGAISFDSEKGKGTRFVITLPYDAGRRR
ncbi:MAG: sensor histidine kinase [Planctomycetes bacterium]|nr:sensor histidine kinase [Planctomycetota bacterium]